MLISALTEYYDILEEQGAVPAEGFCVQKVHYKILINENGKIDDIVSCQQEIKTVDKKGREKITAEPSSEIFPIRKQKPGIASEILDHRPKYIFGLNYDSKTEQFCVAADKKSGKPIFDVFKEANLEFICDVNSPVAAAYKKFIENWKPEEQTENPILKSIAKYFEKSSFCFALSGSPKELLNKDRAVRNKWISISQNKSDNEVMGVCSVTGEKNTAIARIHDNKIKGIQGGQTSGCVFIGTNNPAEESYGKTQAYNSGISELCAKKYTTALNYLLSESNHKMRIDDMTVVFWAQSEDMDEAEECGNIFSELLNDDGGGADEINDEIANIFALLNEGKKADIDCFKPHENVTFYIVGMTPNVSRISLRFVYRNSFGNILRGICRHYEDMLLKETSRQAKLWMIRRELISPKSSSEKMPPSLSADIFKAILWGGRYPTALLERAVRRVKTDRSENTIRAGIIKACINRQKGKEEIKMALDLENNNPAYLCGRLFALLEYIQQKAAEPAKLNRTIKDAYFAAACANPARVFPAVIKLSEHHAAKLDNSIWLEKIKGEIIDKLGAAFPGTLDLTQQGVFIIGYYQQKQSFYTKKEDK